MSKEVERAALAFVTSLGIPQAEALLSDRYELLSAIDEYMLRFEPEEHNDERKAQIIEGMGYVGALYYQQVLMQFGVGWVFCEEEQYPEGKVVLGPIIHLNSNVELRLTYDDPFADAEDHWDDISTGNNSFFVNMCVTGNAGTMFNLAAIHIAEDNGQWGPPMFYPNDVEYADEGSPP